MAIRFRIRVIAPEKSLFYYDRWVREIEAKMHAQTEPDLRKYFKDTTTGWKSQPEFLVHHFKTHSAIGVQVYTNDQVYGIVNAGSPSHLIRPRQRGGILRFQVGYQAGTKPGSLKSRPYRRSGSIITKLQVRHPGFTPRSFDELIADDYAPRFARDMYETFTAGLP